MFKVLFYYALRNIFRVRLRSFFTIFVISLVFSLFILLTSIGEELSRQLTNTLDEKKIDIAIQSKFSNTPFSSSIPYEKVNEIITLDDVQYATTLLIGKKRLNKKASLFLLGFSDFTTIAKRLGIGLIKGREFNENLREIAIGQKVARILKLDVGDSIRLDDKAPYLITGIYSIGLDFLDACAYIGMSHAQRLLNRPNRTGMIFLSLKDPLHTQETIKMINNSYPELVAFSSGELVQHLGSTKTVINFIQLISMITFIIASAVLLNTLIMTINERTKEIGILLAIGWSRSMIVIMFSIESLLLSFSGGIIGYLLTYPAITILSQYPNMGLNFIPESPSFAMFGVLMAICLLIGLISAFFPALYGSRMTPARALHHE